jgi:nicotinate phosphoribosyltransferase
VNPATFPGPLFTDLYELTMAAAYHREGLNPEATFSLFARPSRQGEPWGYLVAAGLEEVLDALEAFAFSSEDLAYLADTGIFKADFLKMLAGLRFSGAVDALPEGTLFFPDEPILEITAPLIQAQLLETYLINAIGLASLLTTKASRCVQAAEGRPLVDFSLRRTQGGSAGMAMARAAYLAGFGATSNVLAGRHYGIPVAGTMAHSFVQAFSSEAEAFEAYARSFPERTILLIDTYDAMAGAQKALALARRMRSRGRKLVGVRLDSGDMAAQSRAMRALFDEAGFPELQIFASSGFDEYRIQAALAAGAAIDAFGVGTRMGVSADRPYLDLVYKLVSLDGRPVRKLSRGKVTLAGAKQVYRKQNGAGRFEGDWLACRDEAIEDALPLLTRVMQDGARCIPAPDLNSLRKRIEVQCKALSPAYKAVEGAERYPVRITSRLKTLQSTAKDQSERVKSRPSAIRAQAPDYR